MEVLYRAGNQDVLWSDPAASVYLVCGEEDCLKEEIEGAIIKRYFSPEFADFDLEVMSADSTSADAILGNVSQAPFGSDRRIVIVRSMESWRDRGRQSDADRLAAGIANLTEPACLILVVAAEQDEARRKTAVSPKLDAAVKQHGTFVICHGLRDEALIDWIFARFHTEGKHADREAAEILVSSVGSEMRSLELEIFKLVSYVGGRGSITRQDVIAVVATQSEDVMFQCVDAITRKQTDRSLSLLCELHRHDSRPQAVAGRLLALLSRQFRLLWQAKHLHASGISARDVRFLKSDVVSELPSESSIAQMAFKASDLYSMAGKYSVDDLRWSFDRLLLCDLANKGGVTEEDRLFSAEPAANLQLLVLQLTM